MEAPRTVDEVYQNFAMRRQGLVKALTDDVEAFYAQCDPDKENLCLYGNPDGTWEVQLPAEEVPPELPEPALGINFARDGMQRKDWLALVAVHGDAWLMAVAFYYGAKFDAKKRDALFAKINGVSTVYETLCAAHGRDDKAHESEASARNGGSSNGGAKARGGDAARSNGVKAKKVKIDPADAQGFNKPSPGFILEPSQPLSELKNAQIEVRDARGERIVATGKQRNSRTGGPLENHRVPHGLRANGD
ncbi:hypothetical protein BE221DRAFT_192483 [Ostreococcus tauri]|uniref:Alfin N-terminal domain-containing protein n=1 Tax=Ostreococcus tauri TaxID=70448 RepID=A0A1Y5IB02_OSTTA|nr:hypothetical protein BE221DRAFT_192483 [Ostreococcus tauri]